MSAAPQAKPSEPSMEEILASIRQIIADDQPQVKPAQKPASEAPAIARAPDPAPAPAPVVAAPPPQAAPTSAPPRQRMEEADDILDLIAPERPMRPAREIPAPPPAALISPAAERLISQEATDAVGAAFSNLAHTVLAQNARTLDDIVLDILRPMLKSWLDDNLPTLVERLVRAEIERVARGGR
jgi:cell pole-organizing protein PopZ